MMYAIERSWRLSFGLRLLTVPVSILCIIAFSRVTAWNPKNDVDAKWDWGIRYLEESAFLPVCFLIFVQFSQFTTEYLSQK